MARFPPAGSHTSRIFVCFFPLVCLLGIIYTQKNTRILSIQLDASYTTLIKRQKFLPPQKLFSCPLPGSHPTRGNAFLIISNIWSPKSICSMFQYPRGFSHASSCSSPAPISNCDSDVYRHRSTCLFLNFSFEWDHHASFPFLVLQNINFFWDPSMWCICSVFLFPCCVVFCCTHMHQLVES